MSFVEIKRKISPVLKRYGVKRASLFGSVARGEAGKKSDIDILIRLGKPIGLVQYIRMSRELEKEVGRKVDVITEKGLNSRMSPFIKKDLKRIYEDR